MQTRPRELAILPSVARTETVNSADIENTGYRGAVIVIDVTAAVASPSVVFTVKGKSALGTDYYTILASAAITGQGQTVLRIYPGLAAANNTIANDVLPRYWRVEAVHGDADSITYSVSANMIP